MSQKRKRPMRGWLVPALLIPAVAAIAWAYIQWGKMADNIIRTILKLVVIP